MKDESIKRVIINSITTNLINCTDVRKIQEDLSNRSTSYYKTLLERGFDVDNLMLNIDQVTPDVIPNLIKWKIMYIIECIYQINILNWILKNKKKFPKLNDYQLYKLYNFGEKFRKNNINYGKYK